MNIHEIKGKIKSERFLAALSLTTFILLISIIAFFLGRISVENNANDSVKKDKSLPEDESKKVMDLIQKKTDEKTAEVDKIIAAKEKEIMTV